MSKWFALQATSEIPGNVVNVQKLLSHPAFDMRNPNKVHGAIRYMVLSDFDLCSA